MSMSMPGPLPLIRDAVPADRPAIVEFNRLLAAETEHKVLDPAILDQVSLGPAEPDRSATGLPNSMGQARLVGQTAITASGATGGTAGSGGRKASISRPISRPGRLQGSVPAYLRPGPGIIQRHRPALYVENSNLRAQQTYQALGMKPGGYSVLEELWLHRSTV